MALHNILNQIWYDNHPAYILLLPLSLIYGLIIAVRKLLYISGFFTTNIMPVPVIVVGNLTVGGTGKTPFVIWLTEFLHEKGYKPGIISRGYGAHSNISVQQVRADSDPCFVGDEPLLIARRTGKPVAVSHDKYEAAKQLIEHANCNILICDDGLQHYSLGRDMEIAIIDGDREFGNKYLLPAGPLRESVSRMSSVDMLISNHSSLKNTYQMKYQYSDLVSLCDETRTMPIDSLKDKKIHVVSAIANPDRLHDYLKGKGAWIISHNFPDHYSYHPKDLNFDDNLPIVMTEKDAVKCKKFANEHMWYMPIQAVFDDVFHHRINTLIRENIDGQKIT